MAIERMEITLPETLRRYVEERVADGEYPEASAYVVDLILREREERCRQAGARLEGLLLEGLSSGEPVRVTPEWFERRRAELVTRHSRSCPDPEP